MESSSLVIILGIVGSIASIVGVVIAAPGKKSKIIHIIYALIITVTAGSTVFYFNRLTSVQREIAEIQRIERQAQAILNSSDRSTEGSMTGFMLAGLSFLEKYKARFPETYERAVKVCETSEMYKPTQSTGMSHFENLQNGSSAMYYLLTGIAASNLGSQ
jgi:hypothetical protein